MTVTMPKTSAFIDMLEMILGDRPPLNETGEAWDLSKVSDGTYVTWLRNAAGERRGAVVTNINATCYLGGKLVMMPEAGLGDQAKSRQAEEIVVEAVEEIVNMMRSVINKQAGNEHVSPEPTQPMTPVAADGPEAWVLAPSTRLDLAGECSFGPLQVAVVFA